MMTLPSSSQLIEVVRAELAETLTGVSDDPRVANCLGMVDAMLATIAVRCDHEIGWMIAEIGQIEDLAGYLVGAGLDPEGRIAAGLGALRDGDRARFDTASVTDDYHRASAILADCTEAALVAGGRAKEQVDEVLATRLDHERQIRGVTELVGRG